MPVPPSYADPEQRVAFAEWLEGQRKGRGVPKSRLAASLGHDSTQQINKFLRGQMLPMPDTLQKICEEMGLSWPLAFARAGFYGYVLRMLADLAALSDAWAKEDNVYPVTVDPAKFYHGVIRIAGRLVFDALRDSRYQARYYQGSWLEHDGSVVRCVVPLPVASSIIIAVGAFSRRGDVYKDEASGYALKIFESSANLIAKAERKKKHALPPLLQRADDALRDKTLSMEQKRVIAGEYVTAWSDRACGAFTHYVRLALYAEWGEAGSSVSTVTAWRLLPQYRQAKPPDLARFSIGDSAAT